jgi:F-type H+-transporting ATPase subunit alpha
MKKVAGKLRLDLSQYRELEAFAQFGSELDAETQQTLGRGERMVQALNQNERSPLTVSQQVASIFAGTAGHLDRIKPDRVEEFLKRLLEHLASEEKDLMGRIEESGQLPDEDEEKLSEAIRDYVDDFGPDFDSEGNELEEGESDRIKDTDERSKPGRTSGDGDEGGADQAEAETQAEQEEAGATA